MKIGIDISQIVYQTGVSRYIAELTRHLIDLNIDDRFYLFSGSLRQKDLLKSFVADLDSKKVTHQHTLLSPRLAEFFWNRLGVLSPDNWLKNLDVFHASNWALPQTHAKLVTTIHDLTFIRYPGEHLPYYTAAHSRHLNLSQKRADLVLTDSESTKKDLIAWGMDDNKIKVIYPAAAHHFKPVTNEKILKQTLAKYNLKQPYLLTVATQEPRKNLNKLIEAFKQLKSDHPRLTLALVGKAGWGESTQPIDGVKLLGFVPEADLPGLYSAAKGFVYPSLYEGFGFPVLEAMACGAVVVTSNVSSLPELGGEAAIYVDPAKVSSIVQGIKQLLSTDISVYRNLQEKGFKQAKQFSWEKTAKQTLDAYREVVGA